MDERGPAVGEARDLGRALRTEQNDVEMLPGPWLPHAGHVQVLGRSWGLHGKLGAAARGRQASQQDPSSIMVSHGQPSTEKKAAFRLTLVKEYPKLPSLSRLLWHVLETMPQRGRASEGLGASRNESLKRSRRAYHV